MTMTREEILAAVARGDDLRGSNLSRANLKWANLSRAGLSEAGLSGADLGWTGLYGADLRGAFRRAGGKAWLFHLHDALRCPLAELA